MRMTQALTSCWRVIATLDSLPAYFDPAGPEDFVDWLAEWWGWTGRDLGPGLRREVVRATTSTSTGHRGRLADQVRLVTGGEVEWWRPVGRLVRGRGLATAGIPRLR